MHRWSPLHERHLLRAAVSSSGQREAPTKAHLGVEEGDEDPVCAIVLGRERAHAREVRDGAVQPPAVDVLQRRRVLVRAPDVSSPARL